MPVFDESQRGCRCRRGAQEPCLCNERAAARLAGSPCSAALKLTARQYRQGSASLSECRVVLDVLTIPCVVAARQAAAMEREGDDTAAADGAEGRARAVAAAEEQLSGSSDAVLPSYAASVQQRHHQHQQPGQPRQLQHALSHVGLPSGYFIIKNRGTGTVLDAVSPSQVSVFLARRPWCALTRVRTRRPFVQVIFAPLRQPSVARHSESLQNALNTQLWYLSWSGELYSAAHDGKALDVLPGHLYDEDGEEQESAASLCLRAPTPIAPVPTRESHPLPGWRYDREHATLHAVFDVDPSFPPPPSDPTATPSMSPWSPASTGRADPDAWREIDYCLEVATPRQRRGSRTNATSGGATGAPWSTSLSSGRALLAGFFGRSSPDPASSAARDAAQEDADPPSPTTSRWASSKLQVPPLGASQSMRRKSSDTSARSASPRHSHDGSDGRSYDGEDDEDDNEEGEEPRPAHVVPIGAGSSWRATFPRSALSPALNARASDRAAHVKWRRRQFEIVPVVMRAVSRANDNDAPILPVQRFPTTSSAGSHAANRRHSTFDTSSSFLANAIGSVVQSATGGSSSASANGISGAAPGAQAAGSGGTPPRALQLAPARGRGSVVYDRKRASMHGAPTSSAATGHRRTGSAGSSPAIGVQPAIDEEAASSGVGLGLLDQPRARPSPRIGSSSSPNPGSRARWSLAIIPSSISGESGEGEGRGSRLGTHGIGSLAGVAEQAHHDREDSERATSDKRLPIPPLSCTSTSRGSPDAAGAGGAESEFYDATSDARSLTAEEITRIGASTAGTTVDTQTPLSSAKGLSPEIERQGDQAPVANESNEVEREAPVPSGA